MAVELGEDRVEPRLHRPGVGVLRVVQAQELLGGGRVHRPRRPDRPARRRPAQVTSARPHGVHPSPKVT
ncbi:MAG TPA: hypothetical protein VFL71_10770 [Actinomycetes bacterium]|nr:hypothetical protein [Actinomycetes bacterium]